MTAKELPPYRFVDLDLHAEVIHRVKPLYTIRVGKSKRDVLSDFVPPPIESLEVQVNVKLRHLLSLTVTRVRIRASRRRSLTAPVAVAQ